MNTFSPEQIDSTFCVTQQKQARAMASAVDALLQPLVAFCRTGRRSAALYRRDKGGA